MHTDPTDATNFDTIAEGDALFLRIGTREQKRVKVERVTKTQIITTDGRKYRKADGREVGHKGNSWTYFHPRLASIESPELLINEATAEYARCLRLVSEYASKIAGYADPLKADAEFNLDSFIERANDAKQKLIALQPTTAA